MTELASSNRVGVAGSGLIWLGKKAGRGFYDYGVEGRSGESGSRALAAPA